MKYEIPLHRTESKTVIVYAESPHEALKMALNGHADFRADSVSELIEDPEKPGEEIGGKDFSVEGHCEGCSVAILTGDKYFQWGGDDPVMTCEKCGGADEKHEPSVA